MKFLGYYGGMLIIAFAIWLWASSGYTGCEARKFGGCSIFNTLSLSAFTGVVRNYAALTIALVGWGLMKASAKKFKDGKNEKDNK